MFFYSKSVVVMLLSVFIARFNATAAPPIVEAIPRSESKDGIKSLPDGARVSVNGAVVSASIGNLFCTERSDRSSAIWIRAPRHVAVGSLVDASGTMSSEAGMRVLLADNVTVLDTGYSLPEFCGMNNRDACHNLDGIGLDTSGHGIRVWGRVTAIDSANHSYYISDGSRTPKPGLRIKDHTSDPLPSINDNITINGWSGVDPDAPGIRTVHKLAKDATITASAATSSNFGIISGAISASGAKGAFVRVYCNKASINAALSDGAAFYSLRVPYGTYAVTTSIPGCKTITKRVIVDSNTENPVQNIDMPVLETRIDVIIDDVTITAIVRDEEGRRFADMPVTWNLSGATLYNADTKTNAVGEAKAIVHRADDGAASLEVKAGGAVNRVSLD